MLHASHPALLASLALTSLAAAAFGQTPLRAERVASGFSNPLC
jgi:hypothetical protein